MYKPKGKTIWFISVLFVLLMWPILTIFNRIEPRVLGFPLSVVWPLLIFAVLTIVMVYFCYTIEKED